MNARRKPPATDAAAPAAIRLGYVFSSRAQGGADLDRPLYAVLEAVRDSGSIKRAATTVGRSYRYIWGVLRAWEKELDEP
jgi:molybdenum-dependent DNA-binding transcriptional regulator ModE